MRKLMLLFLLTAALQAQVPGTITFQGVLTDAAGNPKQDGAYNVTFALYTFSSGGSALWTQVSSVTTSRGVFSVQLGSTPFPSDMKFNEPYYLGITIQGGTELSPRVTLNSTPYSMSAVRADTAKTVVDNGITASKISDGSVTSAKILDGTITNADINSSAAIAGTKISPDFGAQNIVTTGSVTASSFSGSIGSGNITAGSVDSTKLAANSVHSGKIADGSIVDTDINSSAGISGAKINPDFGAQNISTTGTVTASNFSGVVVTGGVGGTIGDGTITNTDISGAAQIATTKLSGNVTAIGGHGLGSLATKSTVDSSTITDGSITNADIRGNAGISGAKINPDFGSQNVTTTGTLSANSLQGNGEALTGFMKIKQIIQKNVSSHIQCLSGQNNVVIDTSITVASSNSFILIQVSSDIRMEATGIEGGALKLMRDGVAIKTIEVAAYSAITKTPLNISFIDPPGSTGSHTYSFDVYTSGGLNLEINVGTYQNGLSMSLIEIVP